jgi:DNA/RNA endonuclease YhcR with UshA esterase domain
MFGDNFVLQRRNELIQILSMKLRLLICLVFAFTFELFGDETNSPPPQKIGASEADKYYDKEMIVTGKVAQVTIRPKVVFLNLDKPFPDSPFTLVIFSSSTNQFGDINSLDGKNVEAKGKIKNYHDRPEIILYNTNQLKVSAEFNEGFPP